MILYVFGIYSGLSYNTEVGTCLILLQFLNIVEWLQVYRSTTLYMLKTILRQTSEI